MKNDNKRAEYNPPFIVENTYAGTVVYPPGGMLGPRVQQDLQLVMLHTGEMDVEVDGIHLQIPPGHVTLLRPGYTEMFQFAKEQETWHRWISVTVSSICSKLLIDLEQLPPYIPISKRMNELTSMLISIHNDYQKNNLELVYSLGEAAIWLYITECRNEYQSNIHPAVLKAKELIQMKFSQELSLLAIARECNVSTEHLIRLFNKHENMTPTQYLWTFRIEQGIQLLRMTGLKIGEIAYQTGFKTSYHFSRAVKRHTGYTPTQLREVSRNPSG